MASRDHLIPEYLELLGRELAHYCAEFEAPQPIETLFIGGGTPTHLSPHDLQRLFEIVGRWFHLREGGELSIEANPDGLCADRLTILKDNGVNRLSLGVQSFDDSVLKTLERRHTGREAADAINRAYRFVPNVSVDLIFGVPGQTRESWLQTLRNAIELPVKHVSTYGLTYEQGTPFYRQEKAGAMQRIPDALEAQMYRDGIAVLNEAGYEHYEVSNFAQAGYQCRHNNVYWNSDEYFAFGPGAARYVGGVRSTNSRSVVRWMASWRKGQPCEEDREELNPEERARESIMLSLRRMSGLHVETFESRFGVGLRDLAGKELDEHLNAGRLELVDGWLRLTSQGLLIADTVVSDFL